MHHESLAAMEEPIAAAPPSPIARQQRISSLDVLRGVAVLGILLMNIVGFGMPHWCYDNPGVVEGDAQGANLWTWIITTMVFEGTMRAMFSMLFGAGVILLTSRLELRWRATAEPGALTVADVYYRRNLWLIVFGMLHTYGLLWLGDVLYLYGLVGLFLYPFRRMSPRGLVLMALLMFVVVEAHYQIQRHHILTLSAKATEAQIAQVAGAALSPEQRDDIDAWQSECDDIKPPAEDVREEIEWMRRGYANLFVGLAPISAEIESEEVYEHLFWDAAGMMFLGMALLKLGVLSGERSRATYAAMLAIGYAIGLGVNARETLIMFHGDFEPEAITRAQLTYDVGRIAMVFGHIGLIMLILKSGLLRGLMTRLAACGQMALTNYLTQSLLCGFIFNGYGLARYGEFQRWQLYLVVAGVWLAQLFISPVWLSHFQFGPAEWLWRSLTYWKRQPMRRMRPHSA